ncbi:MAG: glycoside hydrolase family 1 protein [Blastocatellia bacterium]|nr:glycoside hydrolase family 1 protein [Blastocatellia bacterium]MBL8193304.1 glycoside hydrolase family 1 protein [Blastocatellia bacterium]MBN8721885.1 glycoside hydrolase family 1 protein [Acidobacteriota bacterium]
MSKALKTFEFPKNFLWGTATASHQVEGNNKLNDWWAFEQEPGRIHDGNPSGEACRHYELYKEDIALMKQLHQNAHRFSIEWSRIEPTEGKFDQVAIDHYRNVLETLHKHKIEPMLTIHHFTNPQWLRAKGAWETADVIPYFERFVQLVAREYGDLVKYWVTINEPMVYSVMGYVLCAWPPAKKSPKLAFASAANMMKAHAAAYRILHSTAKIKPMVGIAHNIRIFDPANAKSWLDKKVAHFQDYAFNEVVIRALTEGKLHFPLGKGEIPGAKDSMDFIGINYYSRDLVKFDITKPHLMFGNNFPPADAELTLFGWEVYAEGLYRLCKRMSKYGRPIMITENGIPDDTDEQRPRILLDHLEAMHKAISEGIDVQGYFHWSFIDNFEWAEGYRTPFGLIAFDPKTQERTVKDSGKLYAEICRTNSITPDMRNQVKGRSATPKKHFNLYGDMGVYVSSNAGASNR